MSENLASQSDEILRDAGNAIANQKFAKSIGAKSAQLKSKHRWSNIKRAAVAVGAIWVGTSILGVIVNGIGLGGLAIALGLSGAAIWALLSYPKMPMPTRETLKNSDLPRLAGQTEIWLEQQRAALPPPAVTLVENIGTRLDELAPQLARIGEHDPAAREVRTLVGEHLPELVNGYRELPDSLKKKVHGGSSPEDQLINGLKTIDQEIESMTVKIAKGELDKLATRERFLELKYDRGEE